MRGREWERRQGRGRGPGAAQAARRAHPPRTTRARDPSVEDQGSSYSSAPRASDFKRQQKQSFFTYGYFLLISYEAVGDSGERKSPQPGPGGVFNSYHLFHTPNK